MSSTRSRSLAWRSSPALHQSAANLEMVRARIFFVVRSRMDARCSTCAANLPPRCSQRSMILSIIRFLWLCAAGRQCASCILWNCRIGTKGHLIHALLEGVRPSPAYRNPADRRRRVRRSGVARGGARSLLWPQIFADVLGVLSRLPARAKRAP